MTSGRDGFNSFTVKSKSRLVQAQRDYCGVYYQQSTRLPFPKARRVATLRLNQAAALVKLRLVEKSLNVCRSDNVPILSGILSRDCWHRETTALTAKWSRSGQSGVR